MTEEYLSQDEVDTLLRDLPETASSSESLSQLLIDVQQQNADFVLPERFFLQLAEDLSATFSKLLGQAAKIKIMPFQMQPYKKITEMATGFNSLHTIELPALDQRGLVLFDPDFVFMAIDHYFGGDGRFHHPADDKTPTYSHQHVLNKVLSALLEQYQKNWQFLYPLQCKIKGYESDIRLLEWLLPDQLVAVMSVQCELPLVSGQAYIVLSYQSLKIIRQHIEQAQDQQNQEWAERMTHSIRNGEVELIAELASTTLTCAEILQMKVGDVLPLNIAPTIDVCVDKIPVANCHYGTYNGRYALRIEHVLLTQAPH